MKQCMLVVNPQSGKQAIHHLLFKIVQRLSTEGYIVTVYPTAYSGHAIELVERFSNAYDILIACGGDGTLNEVVNGLMRAPKVIPLGYIPMGTTNDFARTLQLSLQPMVALNTILKGSPHPFDIGTFNERYFLYVSAFGAFADVSYLTPQPMKNLLGKFAYFVEGLKKIPDLKNVHRFHIEVDGKTYEDEYAFVSVSNSLSLGGIVQFDPKDLSLHDGFFELMLIKMPSTPAHLQKIMAGLFNHEYDKRYIHFIHGKSFHIHAPQSIPWTIDGEAGGWHESVHIKVVPQKLELVY